MQGLLNEVEYTFNLSNGLSILSQIAKDIFFNVWNRKVHKITVDLTSCKDMIIAHSSIYLCDSQEKWIKSEELLIIFFLCIDYIMVFRTEFVEDYIKTVSKIP